jgi:hypothetical protein
MRLLGRRGIFESGGGRRCGEDDEKLHCSIAFHALSEFFRFL